MGINTTIKTTDLTLVSRLNLEAELETKRQELRESPLYQEITTLENQVSQLKSEYNRQLETVQAAMLDLKLKEFMLLDGRRVLLKKSPGKVKITNEKLLTEYMVTKEKKTIDKKRLLTLLREGHAIDGAELDVSYSIIINQK